LNVWIKMSNPIQSNPLCIVGVGILDEENRLFLIRSSGKFGDQWIIPGGKVQYGETREEALIREIHEETAIQMKEITFLGIRELIEPSRHFICLEYKALLNGSPIAQLNYEATEYGWFTANQLQTLPITALTKAFIQEHLSFS
jgi:nucleoside triphosphatase